jgi:TonB family protein
VKALLTASFVCLFSALVSAQNSNPQQPIPAVKAGAIPVYPDLPRMARIQGEVVLRVSTDGEKPVEIVVEHGQPMLAKAAKENVQTWQFVKHPPTVFRTTFIFELPEQTGCEPSKDNGQTVLMLPTRVEISMPPKGYDCDPNDGLDMREPLRVFLTSCEADGHPFPCDKTTITLSSGDLTISPELSREPENGASFVVPLKMREAKEFGVSVKTPKGSFEAGSINGAFLKGKWRIVIDHAPFQEEFSYLKQDGQTCLGIIHFQWSEPERMRSVRCD